MKKWMGFVFVALMLAVSVFGSVANAEAVSVEESPKVIYEAFFLDNDEILSLFDEVRGPEAPYGIMTQDFHVTTVYMPEEDMHAFYGTKVTVRIYAYQAGEVPADDGSMTANEGFFCTVTTDNAELQSFLDQLGKNWHITGSYKDQGGAKYTEYLDLNDAMPVEYTVTGYLGGYLSDGRFAFSPDLLQ